MTNKQMKQSFFQKPYTYLLLVLILLIKDSIAFSLQAVQNYKTGRVNIIKGACEIGKTQAYYYPEEINIAEFKAVGISLISFESYIVSTSLNFTSSAGLVNGILMFQATCEENTQFDLLGYNYIFIYKDVDFLEIYMDCFVCGYKDADENGDRTNIFKVQEHINNYTVDMTICTTVNAMNVSNYIGEAIIFETQTKMEQNSNIIQQYVISKDHTIITSICLTTLIYDNGINIDVHNGVYWGNHEIIQLNESNSQLLTPSQDFQKNNSNFYGIGSLSLSLLNDETHLLYINTDQITDMSTDFQSNSNFLKADIHNFQLLKIVCSDHYFVPAQQKFVTACSEGYYKEDTIRYCSLCPQICKTCSGPTTCTACDQTVQFRILESGKCICDDTFVEQDNTYVCASCQKLIDNCDSCSDNQTCSECVQNFKVQSGKCVCENQTLYQNGNKCFPFPGCLVVGTADNRGVYCETCDTEKNFVLVQDTYYCECRVQHQLNKDQNACLEKCGDGKVWTLQCDDGNNNNTDGCSSDCEIQKGYSCFKDEQNKSVCNPSFDFQIIYLYCERDITQNQVSFYFKLNPISHLLTFMDLASMITFSFETSKIQVFYNLKTGVLKITTDFFETLQGRSYNLILKFDPVYTSSKDLSIDFQVRGKNSWVTYEQNYSIYQIFFLVSIGVSASAWFVALVAGSLSYKHIGIELVFCIQTIYFCLVVANSKAPVVLSLQYIKLINGYNFLGGISTKSSTSQLDYNYFYLEYIQNVNWMICVNIAMAMLIVILKLVRIFLLRRVEQMEHIIQFIKKNAENEKRMKQRQRKVSQKNVQDPKELVQAHTLLDACSSQVNTFDTVYRVLGNQVFLLVMLFSIQASLFYLGIAMTYPQLMEMASKRLNLSACLLNFCLSLIALSWYPIDDANEKYMFANGKSKFVKKGKNLTCNEASNENKTNLEYHKYFILLYSFVVILLQAMSTWNVKNLVILPASFLILPILILIFANPYEDGKQDSSVIKKRLPLVQQVVLTVPIIFIWIITFMSTAQQNSSFYFFLTISIVASSILGILLSIVRIIVQYCSQRKPRKVSKEKQAIKNNQEALLENSDNEGQEEVKENGNTNDGSQIEAPNEVLEGYKGDTARQFLNWEKKGQQQYMATNKKKKSKLPHKTGNNQDQENEDSEIQQENLEMIKKKLRLDLRSRRKVDNPIK